MSYADGTTQQPEPIVVERGSGYSVVWPQPQQPPTEPGR